VGCATLGTVRYLRTQVAACRHARTRARTPASVRRRRRAHPARKIITGAVTDTVYGRRHYKSVAPAFYLMQADDEGPAAAVASPPPGGVENDSDSERIFAVPPWRAAGLALQPYPAPSIAVALTQQPEIAAAVAALDMGRLAYNQALAALGIGAGPVRENKRARAYTPSTPDETDASAETSSHDEDDDGDGAAVGHAAGAAALKKEPCLASPSPTAALAPENSLRNATASR